jgi:hypothetical protein
MTKSQVKALVAGATAALATLDARMDLLTAVLPPKYAGWLRTAVIVAGVLIVMFNQSLSTAHVSVPVEEAKALGLMETKEVIR